MSSALVFLASFLASAVEGVEALTIVLAVGITRGWRSTMTGVAAATGALIVIVAALGPALTVIPIRGLRIAVGGLLLVFGLQWLRKAILRASGHKALHDEEEIYRREAEQARTTAPAGGARIDGYAFAVAFKGVLLEGLEVAFIVVTFGSNQHDVPLAAAGAAAAVLVVVAVGLAVHAPLARVPENAMKFTVGLLLTTFGTFWAGEGISGAWPGGDAALLAILAFYAAVSFAMVRGLARGRSARPAGAGA
jgi:uncharacterized membrane protein